MNQNLSFISFYNGHIVDVFWPKKVLIDEKGLFGGKVFKN